MGRFHLDLADTECSFSPLTAETLNQYAKASGDFNPIHLDNEHARAQGLPGVIAHGMLSMAYLGVQVEKIGLQNPGWILESFKVRFRKMVFLGDKPLCRVGIKSESETQTILLVSLEIEGESVVTDGEAVFIRD